MIKRILVFIFFVLSAAAYPLIGAPEEPKKVVEVSVPDPVALQPNWWDYFQGDPQVVATHIGTFSSKLGGYAKDVSEVNQPTITSLIDKVQKSLSVLLQSQKPAEVTPSAPKVFAESYSISDLLEVFAQRRLTANELITSQEDKKDKQRALAAARDYLGKVKKEYADIHDRSEAKLILGLKIITYQLNIGIAQAELAQIEKQTTAKEEDLKRRDAEFTYALEHLFVSDAQLTALDAEMTKAHVEWDTAKDELIKKEAETAISNPFGAEDSAVERQQLFTQEVLRAMIAEAIAHHHFRMLRLESTLASMISGDSTVDPAAVYKHLLEEKKFLDSLQKQVHSWQETARRQVQRSGQALGLIVDQNAPTARETVALQKEAFRLGQENLLALQKLSNEMEESRFLLDQLDGRVSEGLGARRKELMEVVTWLSSVFSRFQEWATTPLFDIGENPVKPVGILKFLVVMLVAIWLARAVSGTLATVAQQRIGVRKSLIYRINRLIYYAILILGVFIALATLGVDFSSFLLIAGAIGVGLGFGVQSIFNNFLSGIIILFESNLRVGDFIELEDGSRGEIREINIRSTTIATNDGIDILIPNSQLLNTRISNWTLSDPFRRVHIPFVVAHGTDKDLVARIVTEAAVELPYTMGKGIKSEPKVFLQKLGNFGLEFELVVWVDEMASTRTRYTVSDYLWKIETALKKNGIVIPYPHYEVTLGQKSE